MRTVEEVLKLLPAGVSEESRENYRRLFERFPRLKDSAPYVLHFEPQRSLRDVL